MTAKHKSLFCVAMVVVLIFSMIGCTVTDANGNSKVNLPGKKTISFETNGGTSIKPMQAYTLESAPSTRKNGYAFDGWYKDSTLSVPVVFPLEIDHNMTIYAKWAKTEDSLSISDMQIKMDFNHSAALSCGVTPNGFDYDALTRLGYEYIEIMIAYDVRYIKDYDVWLDIGYMGAPKYEVFLLNASGVGKMENDLTTSTSNNRRTISIKKRFADIKNDKYTVTFSTNNIQNIVCISNVIVMYTCY